MSRFLFSFLRLILPSLYSFFSHFRIVSSFFLALSLMVSLYQHIFFLIVYFVSLPNLLCSFLRLFTPPHLSIFTSSSTRPLLIRHLFFVSTCTHFNSSEAHHLHPFSLTELSQSSADRLPEAEDPVCNQTVKLANQNTGNCRKRNLAIY